MASTNNNNKLTIKKFSSHLEREKSYSNRPSEAPTVYTDVIDRYKYKTPTLDDKKKNEEENVEIIKPDLKIDAEAELEKLIGLETVKKQLKRFKSVCVKNKKAGHPLNLHMIFSGNPGTGKTTVARLIGQILYTNGILENGNLVECSRENLIGQYIGESGIKTKKHIDAALGGILFIDEAYDLDRSDDFSKQAMATLIKGMEDNRGRLCVILAGYTDKMEAMFDMNQGIKSRIQNNVLFEDYNRDDLSLILNKMLKDNNYTATQAVKEKILDIVERKRRSPNFANAREVRGLVEQLMMLQAERTIDDSSNRKIELVDVKAYSDENIKNEKSVPLSEDKPNLGLLKKESKSLALNGNLDINILESLVLCIFHSNTGDTNIFNGFVFSSNGFVVTCSKYISNCEKITILRRTTDNYGNLIEHAFDSKLYRYDNNICILKMESGNFKLSYIPLYNGEIDNVRYTNDILEIGYSLRSRALKNIIVEKGYITSKQKMIDKTLFTISNGTNNNFSGSLILDTNTNRALGIAIGNNTNEDISLAESYDSIWRLII